MRRRGSHGSPRRRRAPRGPGVDDALLDRLRALRGEGFAIALDDFAWHDGAERLVDIATYVKLDVRALGVDGFARHAARLAGCDVILLAEKVETAEEAEAAVAALLRGSTSPGRRRCPHGP